MAVNFPINHVRSFFHLSQTLTALQDPYSCFSHSFTHLNSWINQSQVDNQVDSHLKKVWQIFYASLCSERTLDTFAITIKSLRELEKFYPPSRNLGIFKDTDLLLYPDTQEGPIPLNGIRESSFRDLIHLYFKFFSHLRLTGSEEFNQKFLKDIRTILSRPLGRQLIQEIVNKMPLHFQLIEIRPSASCKYFPGKFIEVICFSLEMMYMIQVLPNGESATIKSPSFINLAHELIHLLHKLNGHYVHIDRQNPDPSLRRLDTNREERRTIYGNCGTEQSPACHPPTLINENNLRRQFIGLLLRNSHHSGVPHEGCAECNFKFAVRYGINGNVRRLIHKVSSGTLNHIVEQQMLAEPTPTSPEPRASLAVIVNEVVRDRSLRQGPLLGLLRTPSPPHSLEGQPSPVEGLNSEGQPRPIEGFPAIQRIPAVPDR